METKHTPGPWGINNTIMVSASPVILPSSVVAHRYGSTDTICKFSFMTRKPHDEERANARLIAAAPDLLDALRLLLDGLETYAPEFMHGLPKADYIRAARAAIAKAEG